VDKNNPDDDDVILTENDDSKILNLSIRIKSSRFARYILNKIIQKRYHLFFQIFFIQEGCIRLREENWFNVQGKIINDNIIEIDLTNTKFPSSGYNSIEADFRVFNNKSGNRVKCSVEHKKRCSNRFLVIFLRINYIGIKNISIKK
jgi:hypothetical protein